MKYSYIMTKTGPAASFQIYVGTTGVLKWKIDYILNDFYFDEYHLISGYFTTSECVSLLEYCKNNINLIIKHLEYNQSTLKDQLIDRIQNNLYPKWLIRDI